MHFCQQYPVWLDSRAKPELLCPVEISEDSPLPVGRVELRGVASGYIDSGFAITDATTLISRQALQRLRRWSWLRIREPQVRAHREATRGDEQPSQGAAISVTVLSADNADKEGEG